MKREQKQTSFQILRMGPGLSVGDMPTMPRRDVSHIELARYEREHEDPCAPDPFFDDMAEHCAEIVYVHNLKLSSVRGSPEHKELQRRMGRSVHKIVGEATFDFFDQSRGSLGPRGYMLEPGIAPGIDGEAIWACYWTVHAFKMLAQEAGDDAIELVGRYIQALYGWWSLVREHGLAEVNAVLCECSQVAASARDAA
ncbi:hypothetical protein V9K97_17760 [Variovorax sp. CCNWLW186]|uniref:hypothetical protein n=1 Tax=Variovorax sp. CCNWLW186 TaxID=3127473 RepID=UPI003077BA99